jgi:hypothetical protein
VTVQKAPSTAAAAPANSQRRFRGPGGSAMSRIARMMLSRLTRTLNATIVKTATTNEIAKESARLGALTVKYISKRWCSELNALCENSTSTRPRPTPTAVPSSVATNA